MIIIADLAKLCIRPKASRPLVVVVAAAATRGSAGAPRQSKAVSNLAGVYQ